ncbi:hypothetical protein TVAG_412710 [Trichomonas vaginalis G3]|uniref:Uncharacterized protein n=1 Tax=Trichomonas vaginalis (strain ATCC PRA-98 / G3) TaxID=412133 RepID=A2EV84_TRIV3|nr:hypothetical protein TVAGG3_0936270 [Trichomonas vaginalis G3]EAY03467.1 hypothetical protein TVAG_412710 [Trichomonas vaginalis G3]KAI5486201.1 hypothetical protein TVAGG3_0936270 [Trichomonas vaginalis G3]|eukprot:XP_001315690.1 hypothetical protein [Trichomonas vaginalis G3]
MIDRRMSLTPLLPTSTFEQKKKPAKQSQKDYDDVQKRIVRTGVQMGHVSRYIEKIFGCYVTSSFLINIAAIVSTKNNIKIDKLARRNRSALLCWFAENWTHVYPVIHELMQKFIYSGMDVNKKNYPQEMIQEPQNNENEILDPSDLSQLINHHE